MGERWSIPLDANVPSVNSPFLYRYTRAGLAYNQGLATILRLRLSSLPINRTLLGTIPADFHRTSQSTVNMLSFFLLFLFFPQSNQPISSPQALNPYLRQQDWPIIYLHFPISRGSYLPLTSKTRMIYSSRDVMAHQDLTTSGSSLYLTQPCAILESRWKH